MDKGGWGQSFVITFLLMFSFWILLSGYFDPLHLLFGIASSLFVAHVSHDFLTGEISLKSGCKTALRFLTYVPWLLYQIVIANLDVAYRTLHPQMPIDPRIIRFRTNLKTGMGLVTLANSITLTPGTVTIDIEEGEFIVHAIAQAPADGLLGGEMQAKVKRIEEVIGHNV